MNNFVTVFLFTQDLSPLVDAQIGLLIGGSVLVVGTGIMLVALIRPKWLIARGWKTSLPLGIFFTLWGTLWFVANLSGYRTYAPRYDTLLNVYNSQKYETVEDTVRVLSIQPHAGHAPGDMIQIGDARFEINYYSGDFGYKTSIAHKGILTEGKYVRVYYYNGTILRIDVKQD